MARSGSLGGQLGHEAAAHRVAGQHGAADAELVDDAPEHAAVRLEVGAAGRQALGATVAGRVDGDDLESGGHDARQALGIEDPLRREPVDHDQGHAATAHRDRRPGGRRRG